MTTPVYPLGQQPAQDTPQYPGPAGAQWNAPLPEPMPVPSTFQAQPPVPLPAYEQPPVPQLADQANAAPQIPEGGYAQRIVRIPLPQFRLEGLPEPWVEMRNTGMMSQDALDELGQGLQGVAIGADGKPAEGDVSTVMATLTKLIRRWCMWDGSSDDDVPPMLPEQVDVASLRRAPVGVLKTIMKATQELSDPQ